MRKFAVVLFVVAMTACGGGGGAAGPPPSLVTPTMLQPPPIYALIGHRDRLSLSSEQIESLDSIAVELQGQNDALIDELQSLALPSRNQAGVFIDDEGRTVLERIRENNRDAAESVGTLLSTEQQGQTCDLFQLEGSQRSRNTRPRVRGADPAASDSIWRALEARVWPWCGQAPESDEDDG